MAYSDDELDDLGIQRSDAIPAIARSRVPAPA
jgi:uncharacterized protein YjiS (DUF1127 family)